MERTLTMEEKIRRAEEIYNRRRNNVPNIYNTKGNLKSQKDLKIFKKVIFQIIVCLSIYFFYYAVNNNYIFSDNLIQKTRDMLSYDINFNEIYNKCKNYINCIQVNDDSKTEDNITIDDNMPKEQSKEENNNKQSSIDEEQASNKEDSIGGAELENIEEAASIEKKQNEETNSEQFKEMTQEERDILEIKSNISFIKPIEGTISSTFGWRNPTTATVPKYHTGLDIAAPTGTVIKSATDGIVSLSSSQGDYRKSFKNRKWRINNNLCTL